MSTPHPNYQMSDAFRTAALLAVSGGFLESYAFLLHGQVFANAQTGNIALCGMALMRGAWMDAARYLVPILSFAIGVGAVQYLHGRFGDGTPGQRFHWRQGILIVEMVLLSGCFFLTNDIFANLLISFTCALQVQAFRKVHDAPYASTMCTGNLRSATIAWWTWWHTRQREVRHQALSYTGVISLFLFGAALGYLCVQTLGLASIGIPILLLLLAALVMAR